MRKTCNSTYVSYKKVGWHGELGNSAYLWCGKFEDVNNYKV